MGLQMDRPVAILILTLRRYFQICNSVGGRGVWTDRGPSSQLRSIQSYTGWRNAQRA